MGKVGGFSYQELLTEAHLNRKNAINDLILNHKTHIDTLIDGFKKEDKSNDIWGWGGAPTFGFVRGIFNSIADMTTGIHSIYSSFLNNVHHLGENFVTPEGQPGRELAYLFADLGISLVEGFGGGLTGAGADILSLFGVSNEWAYDENKGLIPKVNKLATQLRTDILDGSFGSDTYENILTGGFGAQLGHTANEKILAKRWATDEQFEEDFQNPFSHLRRDAYNDLMGHLENVDWVKEKVIAPMTFQKHFEEKYGRNEWYQKVVPLAESMGRIVPAIVLSYFGKGAGVSGKTLASSYFFSSVAGASFKEALEKGASMNDAFTYAYGTAVSELVVEMAGGFNFVRPSIKSFPKLLKMAASEGAEEAITEFGQKGLSFYGSEHNIINKEESTQALLSRVFYSSIAGGITGGIFGGASMAIEKGTLGGKERSLTEVMLTGIDSLGVKDFTKMSKKTLQSMEKALNDDSIGIEQRNKILEENPIINELFTKKEGVFELTEKGQKIMEGEFFSTQEGVVISKDTHAVGSTNFFVDYVSEVEIKGEIVKTPIITKEAVKRLPKKTQQTINWALETGLNVAFVSASNTHGFFDATTDVLYINVNSTQDLSKIISHEIHDKISYLARHGFLTKTQKVAYQDFFKHFNRETMRKVFENTEKEFTFDEQAYREQYKNHVDLELIIDAERMSAFIEQGFNNEAVLHEAFKKNQSLMEKIASIFTRKTSFDMLLRKLGLKNKTEFQEVTKEIEKIQKSFTNVIKEFKEQLKAKTILEAKVTQEQVDKPFFSIEKTPKKATSKSILLNKLQKQALNVSKDTYQENEQRHQKNIEKITKKTKLSKKPINVLIRSINNELTNTIKNEVGKRLIANHVDYAISHTLIYELNKLNNLIEKDKSRTNKTFSENELTYIVNKVSESIFSAMKYMDSEFFSSKNKTETNPNGLLYVRGMHHFFRDIIAQEVMSDAELMNRGRNYFSLIKAILNLETEHGPAILMKALKNLNRTTKVEVVVDLSLKKGEKSFNTLQTTVADWKNNTQTIQEISSDIGYVGMGTSILSKRISSLLDVFTVSEIVGLFDEYSWSNVLLKKIAEGAHHQITIDRVFKAIFEENQYTSKKHKEIKRLENEKNAVELKNLEGAKVHLSQVIYFRNMMLREIARNKAIDMEIIQGEKTTHFETGDKIDILKITPNRKNKQDEKKTGKIVNSEKLLIELDNIIEQDAFMKEYNAKVNRMFKEYFPFINERYKELHGRVLTNDGMNIKQGLKKASKKEEAFFEGLPESINLENIDQLYAPFLLDNSSYFKDEPIDIKQILDLGVFDGMTQDLTKTNAIISVESINNVITKYTQEVSNFYGLHRVMRDLNLVLNAKINEEGAQIELLKRNIPKQVQHFYTKLLLDMAGYKPERADPDLDKFIAVVRRNFFKATLAANVRVLFTQFATMLNLTNIYGDGIDFLPRFMANFYTQLTKENRALLKKMESENNIYFDRMQISSFEVGEASVKGITGHTKFNVLTEFLMQGIGITDNMINKAFYLTLLDTKNKKTGKNYTEKEAGETLTLGILRSQSSAFTFAKSPILRTDSDIIRMFMKFMGEPLKLVTQLYSSKKKLELIKKLEKNKDKVIATQKTKVDTAKKEYVKVKKELVALEKIEDADDFAALEDDYQKEVRKGIKKIEKALPRKAKTIEENTENLENVKSFIETTIKNKAQAKNLAKRRVSAIISVMAYMTSLGIGFDLIRSEGGEKDEDKKEQTMIAYLSKKFASGFVEEIFSLLPFVRDIYKTVAQGFDLDNFDEIGSFNDLIKTIHHLGNNITSGKKVNWGRTSRVGLGATLELLGFPVRGLERVFTTSVLYLSEPTWFKYQKLIGKKNRDNIELENAIKEGNTKMIRTIVQAKIARREIRISNRVLTELSRLAKKGQEVSLAGVNAKYTIDGVEFELTLRQQREFAEIYNKANHVVEKIISSIEYLRLNDNMKRRLLTSIFRYYHNLAKQKVLKVDIIPEGSYHANMFSAFTFFKNLAERLQKKQKKHS